MLRKILGYGVIAGLVVGIPLSVIGSSTKNHLPLEYGAAIGYVTMLIALSAVFIAIKRQRDLELGGVIRFWPAFGLGLGITLVASLIYTLAWEATQAMTHGDFASDYARLLIQRAGEGSHRRGAREVRGRDGAIQERLRESVLPASNDVRGDLSSRGHRVGRISRSAAQQPLLPRPTQRRRLAPPVNLSAQVLEAGVDQQRRHARIRSEPLPDTDGTDYVRARRGACEQSFLTREAPRHRLGVSRRHGLDLIDLRRIPQRPCETDPNTLDPMGPRIPARTAR